MTMDKPNHINPRTTLRNCLIASANPVGEKWAHPPWRSERIAFIDVHPDMVVCVAWNNERGEYEDMQWEVTDAMVSSRGSLFLDSALGGAILQAEVPLWRKL